MNEQSNDGDDTRVHIRFDDLFFSDSYGFDRLLIAFLGFRHSFPMQLALLSKSSLSFLNRSYGMNKKMKTKLSLYLNPPSLFDWAYAFKGSWPEHVNKKLLITSVEKNYPHTMKALLERLPVDILLELGCDIKAISLGHRAVLDICLDTDWRTGKKRCNRNPMQLFTIAIDSNRYDMVQHLRKRNLVWNEGCYLAALNMNDESLALEMVKNLATNKPPCPLTISILNRALTLEKYKIAAYILITKKAKYWKYSVSSGVQRIIDEFIIEFKEE